MFAEMTAIRRELLLSVARLQQIWTLSALSHFDYCG